MVTSAPSPVPKMNSFVKFGSEKDEHSLLSQGKPDPGLGRYAVRTVECRLSDVDSPLDLDQVTNTNP